MTNQEYIQKSIDLNLFFLRLMKEHALFLQLGFPPKNVALINEAGMLRKQLADLLQRVVIYGAGHVSPAVLASGELFTRFTHEAERQTQVYTGMPPQIDLDVTEDEYNLAGDFDNQSMTESDLRKEIELENQLAFDLTSKLLQFKQRVHDDVMACRIFTQNYPLLLEHIIDEAQHYLAMLREIMSGETNHDAREMAEHEVFWDNIMGEHAQFIDGLLDPTEKTLKEAAAGFAQQYERLLSQTQAATTMPQNLPQATAENLETTRRFRNFKGNGAKGILSCQIRSVIIPLLADHVLREASHYLRMLQEAQA